MEIFLLIRKISPYNDTDKIIGAFLSMEDAENAKTEYIKANLNDDKLGEQAYKEVDLNKDVEIVDVSEILINGNDKIIHDKVFVVTLIEEGFGQIVKSIIKLFFDKNRAVDFIEELETKKNEWEPAWFEIEKHIVG